MGLLAALIVWLLATTVAALTATNSTNQEAAPALVRLYRDLMSTYVKVRPRWDSSQPVDVTIYFTLSSLLGLDGQESTLTLYGFMRLKWRDEFLVWDPELYGNTEEINLPVTEIWRPDVGVFNSLDRMMGDFFRSLEDFPAGVTSDGTVKWGYNALIEATCCVNMLLFPFDRQHCKVIYSTLTSSLRSINFTTYPYISIIHAAYVENGEFEIEHNSSEFHLFWWEGVTYPSLHLYFSIKRRPEFYCLNLVVPCLALFLLGVLAFCLPVDSGERVSLQATTMLSFSIYQMKLMDYIPNSSPLPILSLIIVYLMLLSGVSLAANVLLLHVYGGNPSVRMSKSLHNFIFRFLGNIVCYPQHHGSPLIYELAADSTNNTTANAETAFMERQRREETITGPDYVSVKTDAPLATHEHKHESWHAAASILNRFFLGTIFMFFLLLCAYYFSYSMS